MRLHRTVVTRQKKLAESRTEQPSACLADSDMQSDDTARPEHLTRGSESGPDSHDDAADRLVDEPIPESRSTPDKSARRLRWPQVIAFGVLPFFVVAITAVAAYLKWQDTSMRNAQTAGLEAVQAARDSTVAMLSYQPDTVDEHLTSAQNLLTGSFKDSYSSLIRDVVAPGAKQKQISAVATVPAAAMISADSHRAVVLVFINQTIIVGDGAPTATSTAVRVTLDNIDGRWLISNFDPI